MVGQLSQRHEVCENKRQTKHSTDINGEKQPKRRHIHRTRPTIVDREEAAENVW